LLTTSSRVECNYPYHSAMGTDTRPHANVRRANSDDAAAVFPLTEAFATSYVPEWEAFESAFGAMLMNPSHGVFVAEMGNPGGGKVVGYAVAHRHATLFANAPVAWVEELMVSEQYRLEGIGAALMDAAEDWAREAGCAYVALATRRAQEFYEAIGYESSAAFFRKRLD
jgi:GNAT superfamily N-acetyltransferase